VLGIPLLLPSRFSLGPSWVVPAVAAVLLAGIVAADRPAAAVSRPLSVALVAVLVAEAAGIANATAFSPTDVMPLARWAKAAMTVQAVSSLVILGLVIARAVNILQ
jgi:hypothetical protein